MPPHTEEPFPPYTFVPGGPWPHPRARGPSAAEPVPPIADGAWSESPAYLRGIALFNAGYYWEAHEAWESLWHAHGRRGPVADVLKGLIKLGAAGVKVREGRPTGVVSHARRAAAHFQSASNAAGSRQLGLDLDAWIATAHAIAAKPPTDPGPPGAPVSRVFSFRIEPRD